MRLAALAAGLALGLGLVLGPWHPYARWVRLETPSVAHPGTRFPVQIHLLTPTPGRLLHVDLHALNPLDRHPDVIAAARLDRPASGPEDFRVEFNVPAHLAPTSRLSCVIYTTDSGRWADRRSAAHSESIPVRPSAPRPSDPDQSMRERAMFPVDPQAAPAASSHPAVRIVESLLFLASAIVLGIRAWTPTDGPRRRVVAWAGVYLAAAVLAGTEAGPRAADLARQLAADWAVYEGRQNLQRAVTAMAIAGACWMAAWGATDSADRFRDGPRPVARTALMAWIALQGLNAISLHGFDSLHRTILPALSCLDVLRLLFAAAAMPWIRHPEPRN